MIQIVEIENPFEPKKKIKEVLPTQGPISDYVDIENRDIILNGLMLTNPEKTYPVDGDQIIVMPHIAGGGLGKILGYVAQIALMAYAGNVAGGLWGGVFKGGVAAFLAAGAVMYLGGRLINAVFPQQIATSSVSDTSSSQTYGWDLPTTTTSEGGIIGETYGECIPGPQLLEEHIETVDSVQYLNLLYCGGYGPIDSVDKIRIDATDIDNFTDVQIETRLGTNDQEPISFFPGTPLDQSIGLELDLNKPLIRTSDSTKATALEVTIEWPNGLYHLEDNGSYGSTSVSFTIEYRKTGDTVWKSTGTTTATAAQSTALRKSYKISDLEAGQYDVRVTFTSKPSGSRYSTIVQWAILTSYISGTYSRPNKVLVAMRILATNQLSGGVPNVTWKQTRGTVWVYNPTAAAYEAKSARNPIWAAYDIMHGCKRLKNINTGEYEYVVEGTTAECMSKYYIEWVSAAAYADEQVKNQDGEMEARFEFDAFFDTEQKRITAAQKAAAVGRATIIPRGRSYGITVDEPGDICQIFGEGRTTVSSISGTFTSKDERAKAVEITYNDADNDFKNTVFMMRSPTYNDDMDVQDNPAKLTLFGVKRRSQAYREAIYTLAGNELQLQFVELKTDIDSIVASYGDIVGLNHAVSQMGIASGRVISATESTITLDKSIDLDENLQYEIILQLQTDEIIKKTVVPRTDSTNMLTVSVPFDAGGIPQQYDNYAFGEAEKAVKPFRIVSASKSSDLLCSLKLAEYNEALYTTELNYDKYPVIDYTPPNATTQISGLSLAEENYLDRSGTVISVLHASWQMGRYQQADGFMVLLSTDGITFTYYAGTPEMKCAIQNIKTQTTYWVKIIPTWAGVYAGSETASIYITGKNAPPSNVEMLSIVQSGEKLIATIEQVADIDIDHYELRKGTTWDKSSLVAAFTGRTYTFDATEEGTLTFFCKAVDTSGNYSTAAAESIINVTSTVVRNIILKEDMPKTDWLITSIWKNLQEYYQISPKKVLGDYVRFSDVFGTELQLKDDAQILLPAIDLGENIIDESCFFESPSGIMKIKYTTSLGDYTNFVDFFGTQQQYMQPKYKTSTFMAIGIDGYSGGSSKATVQYRTSINNADWSDWTDESVTLFSGRYVQIRVMPKSIDGISNYYIKGIDVKIDVPDVEEIKEGINITSTAAKTIEFTHRFTEIKSIAAYTQDLAGKQATCSITNQTMSSLDMQIMDATGAPMDGLLQKLVIRGY